MIEGNQSVENRSDINDPFLKDKMLELITKGETKKPEYKPFVPPLAKEQNYPKKQTKQTQWADASGQTQEIQVPNYLPIPTAPGQNMYYFNPGQTDLKKPFITNYTINVPHNYYERGYPVVADYLPMKGAKHSAITLSERLLLYQYIIDGLIRYAEGETACLHSVDQGFNLLTQIKHVDPTPVNVSLLSNNPYFKLSKDLRIYKTCYPIMLDKMDRVICQPNSVGMHIRIYKVDESAYNLSQSATLDKYKYNIWREIDLYKHIRNNYLKKKICPHFALLYSYYRCPSCQEEFRTQGGQFGRVIAHRLPQRSTNIDASVLENLAVQDPNIKHFVGSNKALILLTEGPNYNILEWMSGNYKYSLDTKIQVNKGIYRSEIWKNVLFQIIYTLAVLENDKICITNFNYDNIWIKEVLPVGYWLYIIDGVKYYLPNTGYLVMIDMGYTDTTDNDTYRILRPEYGDTNIAYTNYRNITSANFFGRNLANINIKLPPDDIISLLASGNQMTSLKFITHHMKDFLHNRIGTYMNIIEQKAVNIKEHVDVHSDNLNGGELVLIKDRMGTGYTWGMCVNQDATNGMWNCFVKDNPKNPSLKVELQQIDVSRIRKYYNEFEPEQRQNVNIYPPTCDLNTNPLETYIFTSK